MESYTTTNTEVISQKRSTSGAPTELNKNLQDGQINLQDGQINLQDGQVNLLDGQVNLQDRQINLLDGQVNLLNGMDIISNQWTAVRKQIIITKKFRHQICQRQRQFIIRQWPEGIIHHWPS
jgi:hypothetical protein